MARFRRPTPSSMRLIQSAGAPAAPDGKPRDGRVGAATPPTGTPAAPVAPAATEPTAAPRLPSVADPQYATRVRLALYAADVGAWDYDLLAGAVWWDPRCGALLGADPTGIRTYADLLALVHPDDR